MSSRREREHLKFKSECYSNVQTGNIVWRIEDMTVNLQTVDPATAAEINPVPFGATSLISLFK